MRYGIISDIHGNLEALEVVLNECRKLKIGSLLCAGDIVGYGANPKECLDIVRKLKAVIVAGNHDWAISGRLDASYFTEDGKAAIMWTRTRIALEDIAYMNDLPLCLKNKDCILVHGTLNDPSHFIYLTDISKAAATFALMDSPVCFVGHTHVPMVLIERGGNIYKHEGTELEIRPECKYIINPGSIGQPRDGNPLASFGVYDTQMQTIEIRRVLYDVQKAQRKIIEAGLPKPLALRLAQGE